MTRSATCVGGGTPASWPNAQPPNPRPRHSWLIDAVDRFDPDRGAFASYALPFIRGAVLNLLSTRGGESHLNNHQARSRERIRAQSERLEALGAPATNAAIAKELGKTEQWVRT